MKYTWEDLPQRKNVFTTRNATMRDLRTKKIVQYYSANTRLTVVQKCIASGNTYYRTRSAVERGLDWAFEASAFGLPNEAAPLVPSPKTDSLGKKSKSRTPKNHTSTSVKKQTTQPKPKRSKSGERAPKKNFFARLFSKLR